MCIEVLVKQKCDNCDGQGLITNSLWQEFYAHDEAFSKENNGTMLTPEQCDEWFRAKGYYTLPPEELPCSDCEGMGTIESWMDVKTVLEFYPELLGSGSKM